MGRLPSFKALLNKRLEWKNINPECKWGNLSIYSHFRFLYYGPKWLWSEVTSDRARYPCQQLFLHIRQTQNSHF